MVSLTRFMRRQDGQDLLEYGILASLIAIAALGAVQVLGDTIDTVFWSTFGPSI